jgi:hypothetical protein
MNDITFLMPLSIETRSSIIEVYLVTIISKYKKFVKVKLDGLLTNILILIPHTRW